MLLSDLSPRSLEIFRELVNYYLETGMPVGSRTLSKRLNLSLSPATIRNIMADLEDIGVLYAPHSSSGRIPTHQGLKLFVNGLLEVSDLNEKDFKDISASLNVQDKEYNLEDVSKLLSKLSKCIGFVTIPKNNFPIYNIEFVRLSSSRILLILISKNGEIENKILDLYYDISDQFLEQIHFFLKSRFCGKTLFEIQEIVKQEIKNNTLDEMTKTILSKTLDTQKEESSCIIQGQSSFIEQDYQRDIVKNLFSLLEHKETLEHFLKTAFTTEGIQIFIGAENELFNLSGCSLILSPYHNIEKKVIGALGIIGPSCMDYKRIISIIDCTSKLLADCSFK